MKERNTLGLTRTSKPPQRDRIMARDGHTCRYCGEFATVLDHVVPYAAGGRTKDANLVAACRTCNYIASAHRFNSFAEKKAWVLSRREKHWRANQQTVCVDCHRPFDLDDHGATRFLCPKCNAEDIQG